MKLRLVRALQRGGVTAEIRPDIWGIWRGQDRRRRVIGELAGGEIDLLKLRQRLTAAGDPYREVLKWNQNACQCATPEVNSRHLPPLLDRLILSCPSPARRRTFSDAARSLRQAVFHAAEKSVYCGDSATRRLTSLRHRFSGTDQAFVWDLVLREASKLELAKAHNLRPDAVDTKALSVLRTLAQLYGPDM